jgi:hypothetical protein
MGKQIDNDYNPNNAPNDNAKRTNLFACPQNGLQLKGVQKVAGCDYLAIFAWAVAGSGASVSFSEVQGFTNVQNVLYWNFLITDGHGKEAPAGVAGGGSLPLVVNTTELDPSTTWTVEFSAAQGEQGICNCKLCYSIEISAGQIANNENGTSAPTGLQVAWPYVVDNGSDTVNWDENTPVYYGKTFDLGAHTAGETLDFILELFEGVEGPAVLPADFTSYTATATGDVSSVTTIGTLPKTGTVQQLINVVLDITTAGSYSAEVTFTTNSFVYPSYKFNLVWTVNP